MGLVGMNRIELFTGMHPYFNQTWGYMATPFAIVLAWYVVRHRTRGGVLLFAAFLGVVAFAYPLALPVPLLRGDRLRGVRAPPPRAVAAAGPAAAQQAQLLWIVPLFLLLILPLQGVLEKAGGVDARARARLLARQLGRRPHALLPRALLPRPRRRRPALVGDAAASRGLVLALRRAPRDIRWGLGAIVAFGVLAALFFRPREYGWYFHYKALAFVAPLVVAAAAVGLSRLRWQWVAVVALLVLVGVTRNGAAHEIGTTFDQLPKSMLELKQVDALLPADASIRLDMPADGRMLWAGNVLSDQPLCSQRPLLNTSYPHVPISRAADYVLVDDDWRKPFDAVGPPCSRSTATSSTSCDPACPAAIAARARWC